MMDDLITLMAALAFTLLFCGNILLFLITCRIRAYWSLKNHTINGKSVEIFAFFHPYSDGGGGGERVLWQAIQSIFENRTKIDKENLEIVIYSGDIGAKAEDIIRRAKNRFHVNFDPKIPIRFVYLKNRWIVEAKYYPRFTMICQSIGSVFLAFEALWKQPCTIFCDSTGYAFTYPLAKLAFGASVVCYTHYPTISTDMLSLVESRKGTYNNDSSISSSRWKSLIKLIYYKAFAFTYGIVGRFADVVMVNSSWTLRHIKTIWNLSPGRIYLIYPPCDTNYYRTFPLDPREPIILSIGQFRPEKNHKLQIEATSLYNNTSFGIDYPVKLVMIGGARHAEDIKRVEELKHHARELKIEDNVTFEINAPSELLDEYYKKSLIGIHTMWNEHFGIGVVEMMAAGLITIAHNTGGPKADIVLPGTGFLAQLAAEYSDIIHKVMEVYFGKLSNEPNVLKIRQLARSHTEKFGDETFRAKFYECIERLLPK